MEKNMLIDLILIYKMEFFVLYGVTGTTKQKIAIGFGNGYLETFLQ